MQERKLSKKVEKRAQELPDAEFKKRYGKDWKSIKIATAQKQMNEGIDPVLLEKIVAGLLLIFGPLGIKLGFDQLIKLSDKYVAPYIDKLYGKVGAGAKFLSQHLNTLKAAASKGKDNLEQELANLISGLYEAQDCGS